MRQEEADEICRSIYKEFSAYYLQRGIRVDGKDLGYRILYGPPVIKPSIMFVGYQPGGDESHALVGEQADERIRWPYENDYASAKWKLAKRIRSIWNDEVVRNTTGTNINFFRAPNISAWNRVPKDTRRDAEKYCLPLSQKLVEAVQPEKIIVIGLGTFEKLIEGETVVQLGAKKLVKAGLLWGIPAFGAIHLSGARLNANDLLAIKGFFGQDL